MSRLNRPAKIGGFQHQSHESFMSPESSSENQEIFNICRMSRLYRLNRPSGIATVPARFLKTVPCRAETVPKPCRAVPCRAVPARNRDFEISAVHVYKNVHDPETLHESCFKRSRALSGKREVPMRIQK